MTLNEPSPVKELWLMKKKVQKPGTTFSISYQMLSNSAQKTDFKKNIRLLSVLSLYAPYNENSSH